MLLRERVALTVPPLILRLLLAGTFLWLGLGAVFQEFAVQGEQAAALANAGVIKPPSIRVQPRPSEGTPPEPEPGGQARGPEGAAGAPALTPLVQTEAPPAATPRPRVVYQAAEFTTPVDVRRVHWLTLRLIAASRPEANEDGSARTPLWPPALAQGAAPAAFAWGATLAALFGGVFVLIGLMTRFWALVMVVLTLGSIWLTIVGPAVQASGATPAFLPGHEPFDVAAWIPLAWQVTVLMAALALLFSGPGAASIDRPIFRRRAVIDDED